MIIMSNRLQIIEEFVERNNVDTCKADDAACRLALSPSETEARFEIQG